MAPLRTGAGGLAVSALQDQAVRPVAFRKDRFNIERHRAGLEAGGSGGAGSLCRLGQTPRRGVDTGRRALEANFAGVDRHIRLRQTERAADDELLGEKGDRLDVFIIIIDIQIVFVPRLKNDLLAEDVDRPRGSGDIVEGFGRILENLFENVIAGLRIGQRLRGLVKKIVLLGQIGHGRDLQRLENGLLAVGRHQRDGESLPVLGRGRIDKSPIGRVQRNGLPEPNLESDSCK